MHADRKIRQLMAERRSVYNQVTELTNRIKHAGPPELTPTCRTTSDRTMCGQPVGRRRGRVVHRPCGQPVDDASHATGRSVHSTPRSPDRVVHTPCARRYRAADLRKQRLSTVSTAATDSY